MKATAGRTTRLRTRRLGRAAAVFLSTLVIVGLGMVALGRLANTPNAARGLTVGWFEALTKILESGS